LIERQESTRGISFERVPPKVIRDAHYATGDVLKALRPDERERDDAYSDIQMPELHGLIVADPRDTPGRLVEGVTQQADARCVLLAGDDGRR
jgi:hypothetical protein